MNCVSCEKRQTDDKPSAIMLWSSEGRGTALLGLSRVVTKQDKVKLWSSERRGQTLFGLSRVVTKQDKVKLWSSERRGQTLFGLSRVVTKQDKVNRTGRQNQHCKGEEYHSHRNNSTCTVEGCSIN